MTIDSITTSMRSMGKGSWAILAILLIVLVGTAVLSYLGWTSAAGTDVPASGYIALALGVIFSLAVGVGLMALVFYSSRAGYDEPARLVQKDDVSSDPLSSSRTLDQGEEPRLDAGRDRGDVRR